MINEYDAEKMRGIVKPLNGRHSDKVLREIMRGFSCGPTRASHLLHDMVRRGDAQLDGLRVKYVGV